MTESPIYHKMNSVDTSHIILISMVAYLISRLITMNTKQYRISRLESMLDLLYKIESSYEGYIPENHKNRAVRFLSLMGIDIDKIIKDINKSD